jgi:O-methyltransferase
LVAGEDFYVQPRMNIDPQSARYKPDFARDFGGLSPRGEIEPRTLTDLEPWDCVRRDLLFLQLRGVIERRVEGDWAELGVYQGSTARLIHHYAPERKLHLFDTFAGFDAAEASRERARGQNVPTGLFADTSVEGVRQRVAPVRDEQVIFHAGFFPGTTQEVAPETRFAFVHLDADLYDPTLAGLEYFYPRMPRGGVFVVHDYNAWRGAREAVDYFLRNKPEMAVPMPDQSGSVVIVRMG